MKNTIKKLAVVIGLLGAYHQAGASVQKLSEKAGKVEFQAIGNPGFLKINGEGDAPTGEMTVKNGKLQGTFKLNLSSLKTGMSLRNKHMKNKYLNVDKYPEATLVINTPIKEKNWSVENPEIKKQKVKGELEIHGVKKPITLTVEMNKKGEAKSDFKMDLTDFNIEIPSFMGVTVAKTVDVHVKSQIDTSNKTVKTAKAN